MSEYASDYERFGEVVDGRIDYRADAEAWASGRLRHTEECQINRTPPAGSPCDGFPFEGFSCNCGGVEVE